MCLCGFSCSPEDTNTFIGKLLVCGLSFQYSISPEKLDMFLAKYNLPLRQWIHLQASKLSLVAFETRKDISGDVKTQQRV